MFFGGIGGWFISYGRTIERVMGLFVIVLGISYLGFWNLFKREYRFHTPVKQGLVGAPLLGAAILSAFYGFGLGLPFLLITFALEKAVASVSWLRKRQVLFLRIGGILLILIGILLATGLWSEVTVEMRILISGFTPVL
jgi:cytochrome c-type biogenesis protein